jgi:hypothetical protein
VHRGINFDVNIERSLDRSGREGAEFCLKSVTLSTILVELFEPEADLRISYRRIGGKSPEARWSKPDWNSVDPKELTQQIIEDFARELESMGFRLKEVAYMHYFTDRSGEMGKEPVFFDDLLYLKIFQCVLYRTRLSQVITVEKS